jgi:hypothetical protein
LQAGIAALRSVGILVLGLVLGITSLRVVGDMRPDPAGMVVPIVGYVVIGGAALVLAPPVAGVFLLVGWAAPWLLVLLVVADEGLKPYLPFPAIVTALYVLALGLAWHRSSSHGQRKVPA